MILLRLMVLLLTQADIKASNGIIQSKLKNILLFFEKNNLYMKNSTKYFLRIALDNKFRLSI